MTRREIEDDYFAAMAELHAAEAGYAAAPESEWWSGRYVAAVLRVDAAWQRLSEVDA